ncbi:MAG: glycosyltransferase, partial [Planctomycetota bacterium]
MAQIPTLVALAHLRWDWVFQRPQHLLSRLARTYHVLFVEEPVADPAARAPDWELRQVAPGVTVCRAHTAVAEPGFNATQNAVLGPMLADLWARLHVQDCVAWFYTPMALALLDRLPARAVVYDCMDELSAFKHAPPDIHQRERDLFRVADVVFTGGPSLYRAKQHLHANIHCFPSSVDAAHFGRARGAAAEPADQFGLPHPRLGFFGVIDERLDIGLVDTLARAHPDWQLIMVGPVAKIDPASLPRRPNTHYLGQRAYADLPGYLSGWDACLLPFARNGATRFISPTKTLEYMAAEKPIVSTPIRDVAEPYGDIVYLGQTPQQFVAACEAALAADQAERDRRTAGMRAVLARTSWDRTAAEMTQHIALVLARRQAA